ncbi:MAG TPA: penicillin-binding transpeptidase domain-containing protein [Vicinamibacterales bacterium]|nr:penicillin-binding transpeptidase domain-containing protein [Vicinamibacterales bacterium]
MVDFPTRLLRSLAVATAIAASPTIVPTAAPPTSATTTSSCFLLTELGKGEIRHEPSNACSSRITPASTFKVPHALAALDSGVISGPDEKMTYDGTGDWPETSRRDHTLATAIRYSVVWYFQQIARRLGPEREAEYLHRLSFGNMDSSSGLTTFWIGGSLLVTPEEEQTFWIRLYESRLPLSRRAIEQVKQMLVEPPGTVVNAQGEQPFDQPWPADAVVSAKPGSATDRSGRAARWLVGHVSRGQHAYVFVSCVIGDTSLDRNAAIELAARALREEHVL